ncbi:MAG: hypothetical protein J7521_20270 [Caulobacter sp.]|nr:hypothetical protein [Caulobacter sp.]
MKQRALGRMKAGRMNKMEAEYGAMLEVRKRAGEVAWYAFEGIKLRLADLTFYSPDYLVMLTNGELEVHEVKGFWEDDARVKIKVAASLFPFRFIAVQKARGAWSFEDFS